jgi:hypothetical protein
MPDRFAPCDGRSRTRAAGGFRCAREARAGTLAAAPTLRKQKTQRGDDQMPVVLWILGVPLSIVVLLMLFGVVHF